MLALVQDCEIPSQVIAHYRPPPADPITQIAMGTKLLQHRETQSQTHIKLAASREHRRFCVAGVSLVYPRDYLRELVFLSGRCFQTVRSRRRGMNDLPPETVTFR